ncbi:MAG: aminotransferase class I/II-fold pyridoxal phosphate-dependent enzyme, partial [Planctomycetota bacterium]
MQTFDPAASLASIRHEFGEHGGVNMSIEASTTFTVLEARTMPEIFQGHRGPETGGCYLYGRHFNPTVYVLGRQIAAIEGAEAGYATSSGLGAISSAILQICNHGDHVVAGNAIYGGSFALLKDYLPLKCGITTTFAPAHDAAAIEAAITPKTKLIYIETMSNPTLRIADLRGISQAAKKHDLQVIVDNTFTPMIVTPILHGADIVVHSITKFMNGASDIIGGAIVGSTEFIGSTMELHTGSVMLLGQTMDPRIAFEVSLRLPHLDLRMREHSRRAMIFAERLAERGLPVNYPGLSSHPDHARMKDLVNADYGMGGLLTLDLGTRERAEALMETLQNDQGFGYMAVSLGYFDTLMSCSASSTSSEMSDEDLRSAGISPGLIRMSLGISGALEQRWDQLQRGLKKV